MPRERCRVCDGHGVVGQNRRTCPECGGKGYIGESDSDFPLTCIPIVLAVAALLAAAVFHGFGASWQWLKWLIIVPIIVILLTFLPDIIRWARKRGEDK